MLGGHRHPHSAFRLEKGLVPGLRGERNHKVKLDDLAESGDTGPRGLGGLGQRAGAISVEPHGNRAPEPQISQQTLCVESRRAHESSTDID